MPSRPVILAVVAFWLLTAGWFVSREVLPVWRAGDTPPYTIEFADEALRDQQTRWTCTLDGRKIGTVRTSLRYQSQDDSFELAAVSPELSLAKFGPVEVTAKDYEDRVRVTRDGELRAMTMAVRLAITGIGPEVHGRFEVSAVVRGGRLERHAKLEAPGLGTFEPELEPTDPPGGRVLNPMHPVVRITGLRPGQEWRQPLFDPGSDILRAALAQLRGQAPPRPQPPQVLQARVLADSQMVEWNNEPHECLVIEYRGGEDYVAHTWVRRSDGAVMKQDADFHGETLVLQRE